MLRLLVVGNNNNFLEKFQENLFKHLQGKSVHSGQNIGRNA